jgi:putative transposase
MGLEIRIESWKNLQKSVSKYDLMNQLPSIKDIDWIADAPAQSLQAAIERLDRSYKNFLRTCHTGGGFPKFKSKKTYKSILFKQGNLNRTPVITINKNKIKLPKIGELKMFKDTTILSVPKTATIKKEPTGYFIYIACDINKNISNPDESQVCGIDMGVANFCVDSNGNLIENPKHLSKYERRLRIENRSLSRKVMFSNRWKRQAKRVGLIHHKIVNVRKDFLHKESTKLAKKYHTIFIEDLNIKNMTKVCKPKVDGQGKFLPNGQAAKSGLNKSILDCGWGMFREMLEYKTNVVRVNQKFTSQTCNECGCIDAKNRITQSEFECKECGHISNADENAAKNILGKGIAINRKRETVACALVEELHVGVCQHWDTFDDKIMSQEKYSQRKKQMLNWARTANKENLLDFHYVRWMRRVSQDEKNTIIDCIKKANEDDLDDLYILREELRLGI